MSAQKCQRCGKTVYATEAINVPENNTVWHRGCFKCCDESCGITLIGPNYIAYGNKVYCKRHVPKPYQEQVSSLNPSKVGIKRP